MSGGRWWVIYFHDFYWIKKKRTSQILNGTEGQVQYLKGSTVICLDSEKQ